MLATALLAFLRQSWLLSQYQNFESRRRLSGCEIARQVLDLKGSSQVSVQPVKGKQGGARAQEMLLEEAYYEGTSLLAAAVTVRQAVEGQAAPPFRLFLKILIVPSWAVVLLGFLIPALDFLSLLGQVILGIVFILGAFDYLKGFEARREMLELLKQTGCYEPDELVKLRRLLRALQFEGLAQIVKVPYELAAGGFAKRKNNPS